MKFIAAALAALVVASAMPPLRVAASTASGAHGAVATDQRLATQVGIDMLRRGGNAVDAAIAIAYTLAVTYPSAGNLGGGGFMLVRRANGAVRFYDFREKAPAAATATMYLDADGKARPEASTVGPLAAGVPGTVAGLELARATDATMSRHALLAPARHYAEAGFVLAPADAALLARFQPLLRRFPASAAVFSGPNGVPYHAGDVLRQPALARTLAAIDARGAAGFYRGDVARRFAAAVRADGGIITEADLAAYRAVRRTPITCAYRDTTIVTAPPPSSGGTALCETTGILADADAAPFRSAADLHREIEAERRAFADRNTYLGDPDFVRPPVARLLSPAHIAEERASIAPEDATPSRTLASAPHEGSNTTHFSVIDGAGNAVAMTYTLNSTFGSGAVAGDTGVLLNDEMDDFATVPGGANQFGLVESDRNAVAPGKRPLSSMTPTIVVRDGRAILATGAAGGPRIITSTLDIVRQVVTYGVPIGTALAAPRVHHQWLPDVVYAESGALAPAVRAELTAHGYRFIDAKPFTLANAIAREHGALTAAHDPRGATGSARAY